jgi:tetrahydromethanopterin S-methyltransferase subunit A
MSPTPGAGTDVESWLTQQWEEIILVSGIGPDDNLFEVGGTSMHIVDIHSNIVDRFDLLDLSLVDMFEFTTVRSLAAHIQRCLEAKAGASELSGEATGSRPA